MSRRYCDNYICSECPLHCDLTEKLKEALNKYSYETVVTVLKNNRHKLHNVEGKKSGVYKELNCIRHYCNPYGVYNN